MFNVLIISSTSFFDSSGEIPYLYKTAGCRVDVYCGSKSWLLSNRFYDNWIKVEEGDDVKFIAGLFQLVQRKDWAYDKVVFTDDITVKLVNDAIGDDEALFFKLMPLTKMDNRKMISSKAGLSEVLKQNNIDTPDYLIYKHSDDLETVKQHFHFPVLLKVDFSFSGIGIELVRKPEQLSDAVQKMYNSRNLVIQEFIGGVDIGVEALFHEGKLVMYNAAGIDQYMYHSFSFTTSRNYYRDSAIEVLLTELGEKIGLNGFASIQYIYHQERKIYYLVEVDVRTNSWMPYSRFMSNHFADGIKMILDKKNDFSLLSKMAAENKPVRVMIFDRDLRRCIKNKDIKSLLKWLFNLDGRWKFIPFYDFKLLKRILNKMLKDFLHFR